MKSLLEEYGVTVILCMLGSCILSLFQKLLMLATGGAL